MYSFGIAHPYIGSRFSKDVIVLSSYNAIAFTYVDSSFINSCILTPFRSWRDFRYFSQAGVLRRRREIWTTVVNVFCNAIISDWVFRSRLLKTRKGTSLNRFFRNAISRELHSRLLPALIQLSICAEENLRFIVHFSLMKVHHNWRKRLV